MLKETEEDPNQQGPWEGMLDPASKGIKPDDVENEIASLPFYPTKDWIIVPYEKEEENEAGIKLPQQQAVGINKVTVLMAGPDAAYSRQKDDLGEPAHQINEGDYVLIAPNVFNSPEIIEYNGKKYLFTRSETVVCELDVTEEDDS